MDKLRLVPPVWSAGAWVLLSIVIAGMAIPNTFLSVHELWSQNNHTYSHGYILLLFIGYALVSDRRWLQQNPSWFAALVAFGAGIMWLAANSVQVLLIQQMLIPVLLWCFVAALVGLRNSFRAMVPILALYLALPVADFLIKPLQDLTTTVVTFFIRLLGITAYIDGYDIHLPYGVMRIADGCAGVNYLLAGLCIGLFYSYLNLRKLSLKIWATVLMILLSLLGNWLRVYLLILVGYYSKMESSLVHQHGFFGWVIFAVLAVGFFFYARRIERKDTEFVSASQVKANLRTTPKLAVVAITTALAFAIVPFSWRVIEQQNAALASIEVALPAELESLRRADINPEDHGVIYKGADSTAVFDGIIDGRSVMLFVSTYKTQAQGKELIYFANRPGRGVRSGVEINTGEDVVNAAVLPQNQGTVYWLYRVGDEVTTGDFDTKLSQLLQVHTAPVASAVVLHVTCQRYCEELDVESRKVKPLVNALDEVRVAHQ